MSNARHDGEVSPDPEHKAEAHAGREPAVAVEALVKRYPKRPTNAVDGVSFTVGRGEVFGLLGPNGAGKTTTVGVLTTRVRPTSGRASVAGVDVVADPVAARRALAVVPQRANLDRALTAEQNLLFHAAYYGVGRTDRTRRAQRLLDEFGLADRGDDKVDRFSGGQAQRLLIARALMHDPEVLFLDEPSTGLDPQARLFIWDRVRDLRDQGVTVVLTTHDMDEATVLADRVGIMDHGRLLALDTPTALVGRIAGSSTVELTVNLGPDGAPPDSALPNRTRSRPATRLLSDLAGLRPVDHVEVLAAADDGRDELRLRVYGTAEVSSLLLAVVQAVTALGLCPDELALGVPSLEDVFISLTGRGLRG